MSKVIEQPLKAAGLPANVEQDARPFGVTKPTEPTPLASSCVIKQVRSSNPARMHMATQVDLPDDHTQHPHIWVAVNKVGGKPAPNGMHDPEGKHG